MLVTLEKELNIFNDYIFEISLHKMHCRVCDLFDFDLKIRSGQVWEWEKVQFKIPVSFIPIKAISF